MLNSVGNVYKKAHKTGVSGLQNKVERESEMSQNALTFDFRIGEKVFSFDAKV